MILSLNSFTDLQNRTISLPTTTRYSSNGQTNSGTNTINCMHVPKKRNCETQFISSTTKPNPFTEHVKPEGRVRKVWLLSRVQNPWLVGENPISGWGKGEDAARGVWRGEREGTCCPQGRRSGSYGVAAGGCLNRNPVPYNPHYPSIWSPATMESLRRASPPLSIDQPSNPIARNGSFARHGTNNFEASIFALDTRTTFKTLFIFFKGTDETGPLIRINWP